MPPAEQHLLDKRDEIVWALALQDYTNAQIARIFSVHRSVIGKIMNRQPKDYKPKWQKVQE